MAETDLSAWLLAMEAAMRIGCSTRTVERLGKAKQLETRLRPQKGSPPVAVYNPDDVARIAAERQPDPPPFVLPAVSTNGQANGNGQGARSVSRDLAALSHLRPGDDPIRQFFAILCHVFQSPPSPPVAASVAETQPPRIYLTVREAAAFTGLRPKFLRTMIAAGTLSAIQDGQVWKIRKKDLEAL